MSEGQSLLRELKRSKVVSHALILRRTAFAFHNHCIAQYLGGWIIGKG